MRLAKLRIDLQKDPYSSEIFGLIFPKGDQLIHTCDPDPEKDRGFSFDTFISVVAHLCLKAKYSTYPGHLCTL